MMVARAPDASPVAPVEERVLSSGLITRAGV
jgi:hypothetical protein